MRVLRTRLRRQVLMGRRVCLELGQGIDDSCGGQWLPWRIDFRLSGCVLFDLPTGEDQNSRMALQGLR